MSHHHHDGRRAPAATLYLVVPPSGAVVSRAAIKAHLRVDHDDDDDIIDALTAAATEKLDGKEGDLGRALLEQTWELRMAQFPHSVRLPLPPLIEVVAIEYLDDAGARQTFADTNYHVTGEGDRGEIHLARGACWPTITCGYPEPAIIRFRAGYLDGGVSPPVPNVPAPIQAAIKLITATLYANREHVVIGETAVVIPWTADRLLERYRIIGA